MPNWCQNELTITGLEKDVSCFFNEANGTGQQGELLLLDFNKFVPQPETITLADGNNSDPVYWRTQHWGTKWQPTDFGVEGAEMSEGRVGAITTSNGVAEVRVSFETAWSPPYPVVLAMSKKFTRLEFALGYSEMGVGFHGMYVCAGSEVTRDELWERVFQHESCQDSACDNEEVATEPRPDIPIRVVGKAVDLLADFAVELTLLEIENIILDADAFNCRWVTVAYLSHAEERFQAICRCWLDGEYRIVMSLVSDGIGGSAAAQAQMILDNHAATAQAAAHLPSDPAHEKPHIKVFDRWQVVFIPSWMVPAEEPSIQMKANSV